MKIGINARFLIHPHTGIGQYTRNLIEALAKIDHKNEYFLFTPELIEWNLPETFQQIRIKERASFSLSLAKAHWEHVLVPAEFARWKIDLAHFLYPSNPWKRLNTPTIVTAHDAIPWRIKAYQKRLRSKLYSFYVRMAMRKADHIITPSQFSKQEILDVFKLKKQNITVIPLGAPAQNAGKRDIFLRRDFLLYVGGYDDRKNVPRLIQAYLKFIANRYPVDLILVNSKGKGLEHFITNEYAEWVTREIPVQPKGNIVFTGALDNNEIYALYSQAKGFVHPSLYEGFNLPILESMSLGCPITASDIPVNREVTGGHALFFDPKSIDAIGNAMERLLRDRATRRELTLHGKQKASEYSWEKCAEETLNVYNLFS